MVPPLLAHHNPALPIFLFTDASDFTISGIPHQQGEAGDLHPLVFYSRKLLELEINYSVHNKEMLGIMESLREFRPWLAGLELPISIITDHKNLKYFMNLQCLNHRQARWALELSEFNFKLSFAPGKDNPADVPSHHPDFLPADGDITKEVNWQTLLALQHMERLWVAASSMNTAPSMTIPTIPAPILATTMPLVTVTIHNTYWSLPDLLPTIPDQIHRPRKHPGRSKQKDWIRQPELGCKTQMLASVHHHI